MTTFGVMCCQCSSKTTVTSNNPPNLNTNAQKER